MPTQSVPSTENLQIVLERIAKKQIDDEDGRELLEDRLNEVYQPSLVEKFLGSLTGR